MKPIGWISQYPKTLCTKNSYRSSEIELLLREAKLVDSPSHFLSMREKFFVYEDNFQSVIAKAIGKRLSYNDLHKICSKLVEDSINDHEEKSQRTMPYFIYRGLSPDSARACAFALSFYTGTNSGRVNRGASLAARQGNGEIISSSENAEVEDTSIILYHLTLALSHINFYWGTVTRAVNMHNEDLDQYKAGALVTWIQFSSSMRGDRPADAFRNRNAVFTIQSLTGRRIKDFSNFPEEDEVLFMPHSSFLVTHVIRDNYQSRIFLRQIELGFCEHSILWVDDHILDEFWENKRLMEKASTLGGKINVHFIPKVDTKGALAFLQSPFGQRLKGTSNFRIVTDMHRDNESPAENAGARLLSEVRRLGFDCSSLVFTMRESDCVEHLKKCLQSEHNKNICVTSDTKIVQQFVCFQ